MSNSYLEWPFFESRHRQLACDLEDFAKNDLADIAGQDYHDDHILDVSCREIVRRLGAAGFLGACCQIDPGDRFDVRRLCLSRDILAKHDGLFDFAFAMQGLGTGPISLFGSDEQKKRYLPPVVSGERIAAFALSETEAGSDVAAMQAKAVADGDGYVINGAKTWISNGGIADHYVVFARTGNASGAGDLSAFIVHADNPGLNVSERIQVIAPHPLATIVLSDCRVPKSSMIGEPGQGFAIAMGTLDIFRSTVGAAALGLARRALEEAVLRVHQRKVFGKLLSEFQLTQAKIADMAVGVDAAALMVYRAAWTKDNRDGKVTREASMAKLVATETAQQVIDMAVQLFGGTGVVSGIPVEVLYREIRALRIYEGTSEIQKLVIARDVLKAAAPSD